jgi:hypothetical protein
MRVRSGEPAAPEGRLFAAIDYDLLTGTVLGR